VLGCLVIAIRQSLPDSIASSRKKRQLDVLGLVAFALMMSSFVLFVDFAAKKGGLQNPLVIALAASFVFSAIAFLLIEVYWAKNPVISPSLMKHGKVGSYLGVQVLLLVAQFTVSDHFKESMILKSRTDGFKHRNILCSHGKRVQFGRRTSYHSSSGGQCHWRSSRWEGDQQVRFARSASMVL